MTEQELRAELRAQLVKKQDECEDQQREHEAAGGRQVWHIGRANGLALALDLLKELEAKLV